MLPSSLHAPLLAPHAASRGSLRTGCESNGCGLCLALLLRPSIVYGTRRLAMGLELVMYICRLLACKVLFQLLSLASHLVSEQDTLCSTGCIFLITNMHKRLHVVCLFLHPRGLQFKEAWFRSLWEPEQAHQLVECTCWCQMRHPVPSSAAVRWVWLTLFYSYASLYFTHKTTIPLT